MSYSNNDQRLYNILDKIGSMAALDFSKELTVSPDRDMLDAIALGLNMLSEELDAHVVDKEKLHEVNKKLEKFAFTTAHDLKSPLNSQIGLLNLIEMSLDPEVNSEIMEYVQRLRQVNEKMKNLVEGILIYSISNYKMGGTSSIDFNKVLDEVIESDGIKEKAIIHIEQPLPCVPFNWISGVQVIRNILDNAVKYNDKRSCVITIDCKEEANHYLVLFKDNGPGIAPENHANIFELFNQVVYSKDNPVGGIGLATVKSIMDAEGGTIDLESGLGNGCTFILKLRKI